MKRATFAVSVVLLSCSPSPDKGIPMAQPGQYVGMPFSHLVGERHEFLVRDRALNRDALGVYSEADGIEIPGEIRKINGRNILLFFTCKKDRCSLVSNIILVDLENQAMHVVNWTDKGLSVVVDGPPYMAEFARKHCRATSCD
ncbi:hypothetical protein IAG41_02105 [Sphingomonas sp. JC676]|uniref:hypothetical protein n=1 Tax=Sphingomonas sp. JC676 TaxID=2768065 RepID=UPI00165838BE|nr:hypothetical protein [Sphingomonas sp. JC676]MBC9031173.1 hypothetical protein [Sphingomonas sp. JC676]